MKKLVRRILLRLAEGLNEQLPHDLEPIDVDVENSFDKWDKAWDQILEEQPAVAHGLAARFAWGNSKRGDA